MDKNLPNFRDIPCNKDIYKAYFISVAYYLTKKKTDIFGAILLKWVKEDKISITKINNKDLAMNLGESTFDREIEQKLYDMLKEASKDNILESKEFEKWCKKNSNKIIKWFDDLLNEEGNVLVNEGFLKQKGKKIEKNTIAKNMLAMQIDIDTIAKATNLSKQEIMKL